MGDWWNEPELKDSMVEIKIGLTHQQLDWLGCISYTQGNGPDGYCTTIWTLIDAEYLTLDRKAKEKWQALKAKKAEEKAKGVSDSWLYDDDGDGDY